MGLAARRVTADPRALRALPAIVAGTQSVKCHTPLLKLLLMKILGETRIKLTGIQVFQ